MTYEGSNQIEDASMKICSAISVISCIFVLTTIFLFNDASGGFYLELVLYVTISQLLVAIAGCLGLHSEANISCWFQGIINNIFPLSGLFWSCMIMHILYCTIIKGDKTLKECTLSMHIFCWGVPTILALLPLITDSYGPTTEPGWCFIVAGENSDDWTLQFWTIFSFHIWVYLASSYMIYFYLVIGRFIKMKAETNRFLSQYAKTALDKLKFYPFVFAICWSFASVLDVKISFSDENDNYNTVLYTIASSLPLLVGFFLSVIFLVVNPEISKRWQELVGLSAPSDASNVIHDKQVSNPIVNIESSLPPLKVIDTDLKDFRNSNISDITTSFRGSFLGEGEIFDIVADLSMISRPTLPSDIEIFEINSVT